MIKRTLCLSLFYCTAAFSHFNNMIVFGDSLSDIGNFPESSHLWKDLSKPKKINNTVPQLYVPFSNPVDTRTSQFDFPWPILNNRYLMKQPRIDHYASARRYRSIGWPQFFLTIVAYQKQTNDTLIAPSMLLQSRRIPATTSIDYAWGYALSGTGCANPYYQAIPHCDANSIMQARKNYVMHPTQKNYQKITVPGLYKQVELFVQDMHQHKVAVNANTLYTFWIGGNDLIVASNKLHHNGNPLPIIRFILGSSAENIIRSVSLLKYALPTTMRPQKIYVFNLFNPAWTPAFQHHRVIATLGGWMVNCHNFWLRLHIFTFNLLSKTKIILLPTNSWYQQAGKKTVFKKYLRQACQLNNGDYTHPTHIPSNNCADFMFWNDVHPATPMNFFEARQFAIILQQHSHEVDSPG